MSTPGRIFQNAVGALNRGDLAAAERLFKKFLLSNPNHVAALNLLTVSLMGTGRFAEAAPVIAKAISLNPGSDAAYYNFGLILKRLNKPTEALQQFNKALNLKPDIAETWNNRGTVLNDLRRYQEAIGDFDRATSLQPTYSEAYANKGKSLAGLKRYDDAFAAYDKALALKPALAEAWLGRGTLLIELKRYDEAFIAYDKAMAISHDLPEAWLGRGTVHAALKNRDAAFAAYDKALAVNPALAEAWLARGTLLAELTRCDEASAAYDKALALKPDLAEAWVGRGNVFAGLGRFVEASTAYDQALALKPDLAEAWLGRGIVMDELGRADEAFAAYEQALKLKPDLNYAAGARLSAKIRLCDWRGIEIDTHRFLTAVKDGRPANVPFSLLAMPMSAADQLLAIKSYVADQISFPAIWDGEIYSHDRIRIGYFSADFRQHPVAQLAVGLLEQHDRSRFEINAISHGPDDGSKLRERMKAAVENFIDLRAMNDEEIAQSIRRREIDILVDLTGLCQHHRFSVVLRRPAPVQVNFLGFAATMGADCMDYIIADPTIIPEDHFNFYSERVVWLPDTYQSNDNKRLFSERLPTRAECNLPATGFVFCSFNNTYKITAEVFAIWMKLLASIDDSVLWLLDTHPITKENLRNEAKAHGISPERLIFAPKLPAPDHVSRSRNADLFLDTLPYNAHTTASEALWVGLPVLTCFGETFAGRVAASLLKAVGLPELVTSSLEEYQALALKLAREPSLLDSLKAKLARNRDTCPLFDTERFTRHIEAAYLKMWERYQRGEEPQAFAVPPID